MSKEEVFYTVRGYELLGKEGNHLTSSMEDYLEMAYRLSQEKGYTRVGDLANALNVQPPSVTSMVQKLAETPYLKYEKYGRIELTEEGYQLGAYLLKRHETIQDFLYLIGVEEGLLEETEKIEHNVSQSTMEQIMLLVDFFRSHPEWIEAYNVYRQKWAAYKAWSGNKRGPDK
ncbi:transcriptional regulator MntR [Syntrophomonas erecta]